MELIIVISIIVVVASLAIPSALRARAQSNEAAAIGNLRTVCSAAEGFRGSLNPPAYPANFSAMVTSNPPYLDSAWTNNVQRQGYIFSYAVGATGDTFSVIATPRTRNVTGVNSYCVDQTSVIRRYGANAPGPYGGVNGCNPAGVAI